MYKRQWLTRSVVVAGLGSALALGACESRREKALERQAERLDERADNLSGNRGLEQRLEQRADRLEQRADRTPNVIAPGSPPPAGGEPTAAVPPPATSTTVVVARPAVAPQGAEQNQQQASGGGPGKGAQQSQPQASGGGPGQAAQQSQPQPRSSGTAQGGQSVEPDLQDLRQQLNQLRQSNEQLDRIIGTATEELGPVYRRNAGAIAEALRGDTSKLRERLPQIRENLQRSQLWQQYGDDFERVARAIEQSELEVADIQRELRERNINLSELRLNRQELVQLINLAQGALENLEQRIQSQGSPSR